MRYLAGYIAAVREKMRDELTDVNVELDLEDGEIIGHVLSAVDDVSDRIPKASDDTLTLYACADDDYIVDAQSVAAWTAGSTATLASTVTLSPARNITIKFTDADFSITAFTLTVVGKDYRGTAQTEVFYWAGGLVQEGEMLFSSITSVTGTAITGNSTGDTLDIGFGKWVHKGLSLRPSGPTTMLDLSTCRDNYGQEYFKDLMSINAIEYEVNTETSGEANFRNFGMLGDIVQILYNSELEATETIRIEWMGKHKLTFDSSTLPANLEETVVLGALAHAFSSLGSRKIDMVNIGGAVAGQIRDIALIKRQEFDKKLRGKQPVRINKSYSRE
jgi:hypothetical protein